MSAAFIDFFFTSNKSAFTSLSQLKEYYTWSEFMYARNKLFYYFFSFF